VNIALSSLHCFG